MSKDTSNKDDKTKIIKLKKISDVEYKGPKKTFTQDLSKEEIDELLKGYEPTHSDDLKRGYHIRYFSPNKTTGKSEFKMGGTIIKLNLPKYVVLTNGCLNWTVQVEKTIFFQQTPVSEIKKQLELEFERNQGEYIAIIKQLEMENKNKTKEIALLKGIIKDLKNKK